jgi:hypothetical protein
MGADKQAFPSGLRLLSPAFLAALALEHADSSARVGIHHFPDQFGLSAAPASKFFADFRT